MNRSPRPALVIALAGVGLALILASSSLFVVRVDQFAIVTEFGKPLREVREAGLYFKIPVIQEVVYIDRKIIGWEDSERDTKTDDGRQIDYTMYGRWRIVEPLRFLETLQGQEREAHMAMDKLVKEGIQKSVRSNKLAAIVRESQRHFKERAGVDLNDIYNRLPICNPEKNPEFRSEFETSMAALSGTLGTVKEIESDLVRSKVLATIRTTVNSILREKNGIELLDLHFKYLNYSAQVQTSIIEEIKTERKKDIASYVKVGQACSGYIKRLTDEKRGEILGQAQQRAQEIDGEAVAAAIRIKSEAFSEGPKLYRFLENLDLLKASFRGRTRLILSVDSPLFALMKDPTIMGPILPSAPAARSDTVPAPPTHATPPHPAVEAPPEEPTPKPPVPVAPPPEPEAKPAPSPPASFKPVDPFLTAP